MSDHDDETAVRRAAEPDASRVARVDDEVPVAPVVPERPALEGLEEKWAARWEADGTYRFDPETTREDVFAIDTPPPTVSGSLHIGHVFSYSQTDVTARFWRMMGKNVFYPIGWDDNGLATERRVQNYYGVRCVPGTPPRTDLEPPGPRAAEPLAISRPEFVELCRRLTGEDERAFEDVFRRIGLSVDWSLAYTTVGEISRRVSQHAFLELFAHGRAYRREAPTLWDVDFRSAVAQAELVDREVAGAYHRVAFPRVDGPGAIELETTRPELIPACVALVCHPDDERYRPLLGTEVRTPLFGVAVPIRAHRLADPEKGTGIAMVCTFGDLTDVTWWRELELPTRTVVGRDGRLEHAPFGEPGWESADPAAAATAYAELEGLSTAKARRRIVEMLAAAEHLVGEPRPIVHPVKFYEKGDRPLEIVSSPQWYVRTMDLRGQLLADGRALSWFPEYMRARFEDWVEGLTGDWNISRQRFFGVPFPVWYPVRADGSVDDNAPITAAVASLPVDPSVDTPPGYAPGQRGEPGGFVGDPDVMDTWATSSLSPQIAARWGEDDDLLERVFPMDLRPQGHDIIRTWLFTTLVRSRLGFDTPAWHNVALSGWILDPDRKKMSKSIGNVVVPSEPLERHGADAVRYWAASARLGADTAFDEQQMRVGRRLAIKLLNASRFVLSRLGEPLVLDAVVQAPLDRALLARLGRVVHEASVALTRYDHARALEVVEQFFWGFCDDYLELVKGRVYATEGDEADARSARAALQLALSTLLRLFAPFLPFATEEVWSWWHAPGDSVHRARWPEVAEIARACGCAEDEDAVLGEVALVLGEIRRAKTAAKRSMRAPVRRVVVRAPADALAALELGRRELIDAGGVAALELTEATDRLVTVELADDGADLARS